MPLMAAEKMNERPAAIVAEKEAKFATKVFVRQLVQGMMAEQEAEEEQSEDCQVVTH